MNGHRFTVESGHVLAFARATGDARRSEALLSGGDPAPLTFSAAAVQQDPEHMRGMVPAGALGRTTEGEGSVLHAEQHFEFLRPLRVGDRLFVTEMDGPSWTRQSRRAGTLTFTEIVREYRDEAGELAVRSRMVLAETERSVSDGGNDA